MIMTQLCFTFLYTVFYGLLLTRTLEWLPFTPSFSSTCRKWVGWRDLFRWFLAAVFLIFMPVVFYLYVLHALVGEVPAFKLPQQFWNARTFMTLGIIIVMILPPLGFYDLWQVIVRTWPKTFYSTEAQKQIEDKYSSAFEAGKAITFAIALILITFPLMLLFLLELWALRQKAA